MLPGFFVYQHRIVFLKSRKRRKRQELYCDFRLLLFILLYDIMIYWRKMFGEVNLIEREYH